MGMRMGACHHHHLPVIPEDVYEPISIVDHRQEGCGWRCLVMVYESSLRVGGGQHGRARWVDQVDCYTPLFFGEGSV